MICFRHVDPRWPFLVEAGVTQTVGRWHVPADGPTQYLADTPDGAWAELLRHEDIRDPVDLAGIDRTMWAVELASPPTSRTTLPMPTLYGDDSTYAACQQEARTLREAGSDGLIAPCAALLPGEAGGWRVQGGLHAAQKRDGSTIVLFGERPDLVGWRAAMRGQPDPALLSKVRYL